MIAIYDALGTPDRTAQGGIHPILAGGLMRGNLFKSIQVAPDLESEDGLILPSV
ncbi:hypothetical protein N8511_00440 [Akkermansiaceae bacterium]|nr:hypothetical protein [Akkermansiaceae bacterium]